MWKDDNFVIPIVNAKLLMSEFDQQLKKMSDWKTARQRKESKNRGLPTLVEISMLKVVIVLRGYTKRKFFLGF